MIDLWTPEPPERPGLYWAYEDLEPKEAQVMLVLFDGGVCSLPFGAPVDYQPSHFSHFMPALGTPPAAPVEAGRIYYLVAEALKIAADIDLMEGPHHMLWHVDQMVRVLTDCPTVENTVRRGGQEYRIEELGQSAAYIAWRKSRENDDWEEGTPP